MFSNKLQRFLRTQRHQSESRLARDCLPQLLICRDDNWVRDQGIAHKGNVLLWDHNAGRKLGRVVEFQRALGRVLDQLVDEEERVEKARAYPAKSLKTIVILLEKRCRYCYAMADTSNRQDQFTGGWVRVVVFVDPAYGVMEDVQVEQKMVSHTLCLRFQSVKILRQLF